MCEKEKGQQVGVEYRLSVLRRNKYLSRGVAVARSYVQLSSLVQYEVSISLLFYSFSTTLRAIEVEPCFYYYDAHCRMANLIIDARGERCPRTSSRASTAHGRGGVITVMHEIH